LNALPVSFGGFVYEDMTGNGYFLANDPLISGIQYNWTEVEKYSNSVFSGTGKTDSNGHFQINSTEGVYVISFRLPHCDYYLSKPLITRFDELGAIIDITIKVDEVNSTTTILILKSGEFVNDIELGLIRKGTLKGFTFFDKNMDGIYESNIDSLLKPNVEVILFSRFPDSFDSATRTSFSNFQFTKLYPGIYQIKFGKAFDYTYTFGADSAIDNYGNTVEFQLLSGQTIFDISAGYSRPNNAPNCKDNNFCFTRSKVTAELISAMNSMQ